MAAKSSKKRSTSPKHQQRLSRQGSHTALDVVMFIHLINNKRNTVMQIRQLSHGVVNTKRFHTILQKV